VGLAEKKACFKLRKEKNIVGSISVVVRPVYTQLHWLLCCQRQRLSIGKPTQVKLNLLEERSDTSFSLLAQPENMAENTKKEGWLESLETPETVVKAFGDLALPNAGAIYIGEVALQRLTATRQPYWNRTKTTLKPPESTLSLTAQSSPFKIAPILLA
jgi:hypothetical protein